VPSGHVLFEQGDEGNSAYTIVNGRIRIVASDESGAEVFKVERGRGAIFGEIAMLTRGQPRTATVYAIRDTELAKIGRDGFERMAVSHPEFGLSITRMITGSFLESIKQEYQPSQLTTLAVMPAHQSVPLDQFVERLADSLAELGSVTVLNSERFDEVHGQGASQLPPDHELNSRLVAWLTEIESIHDFVILATDDALSTWTRRCLRTADRTLIVANAGESPELTPIERELHDFMDARITSGRELVLVHSTRGTLPAGSRRWLEGRYLTRHHHLHMDTPGDFARLSRLLRRPASPLTPSAGRVSARL
jgi:CRP-like cAMP-binding protein